MRPNKSCPDLIFHIVLLVRQEVTGIPTAVSLIERPKEASCGKHQMWFSVVKRQGP